MNPMPALTPMVKEIRLSGILDSLKDFDFAFNPSVNRAVILDPATGRYIEEKVPRLRQGVYRVVLDEESYRAPRPFPEKPKNALAKGGEKP